MESVSQQADLIVGLLRAADPFESCSVESRNLSRESTKPHHPVDKKKPSANPADNPESLPEKIDKYFVLDWIARGGFGNVYKAKDPETNRIVAIKVPRLHLQESTEQFLKEACTAAQLDHPSIVQVYDWGRQEDGACFVVMQYIEGHTLRSVLESPSDHAHATNWVVEIAEALHYAHSQNVYHRDVKPENILLDKNDKPYLTDFGLAIREDERWDYEGEEAGTCVYMLPEQVRRESQFIDGRTDIWSLGVVLYELLTRQKPYSARTRRELFEDIEHRNPRPPRSIDDSVSPELETVCLKCLKTRVEDRYLTAGDLSRDLRSCLPNDQIASLPLHRRRGFTAALVSVGMLIVACFAIYFWPEDPAELGFLNEHPKVIAFNSTNPLNFFNPQIDDGRLTVRSFADICIFSYGPLLGDSFTARVNMIVEPDKSSAVFFLGASKHRK